MIASNRNNSASESHDHFRLFYSPVITYESVRVLKTCKPLAGRIITIVRQQRSSSYSPFDAVADQVFEFLLDP